MMQNALYLLVLYSKTDQHCRLTVLLFVTGGLGYINLLYFLMMWPFGSKGKSRPQAAVRMTAALCSSLMQNKE